MTIGIKGIAYENLRREVAAAKLTVSEMARRMNMPPDTLSRKLSGKSPVKLAEAFRIRAMFFPKFTLEYLFMEISNK